MDDTPEKPRAAGFRAILGGGCGLVAGIVAFVVIGIPFGFAASQPCVDQSGTRVSCDFSPCTLVFWVTLLAVPFFTWLGVKVGRGDPGR